MLDGLTNWLNWQNIRRETDALKAKRMRDAWKVMVVYAEEPGT